ELHLGIVEKHKAIGLRPIIKSHVADGAGLDQRTNHRGAERSGAAGNDDMAIAIVHRPLPLLANTLASSPIARPMQGRVMRRLSCADIPSRRMLCTPASRYHEGWPNCVLPSSAAPS